MPPQNQSLNAHQLRLNEELLRAGEFGAWRSIEALVAAGADPLFIRRGENGDPEASIFSVASWNGRPGIVKKLIILVNAQRPGDERTLGVYSHALEAASGFNARIALTLLPLVLKLSGNAPPLGLMGRCLKYAASDSVDFDANARALVAQIIASGDLSVDDLGVALSTAAGLPATAELIEALLDAGRARPSGIQSIPKEALSNALVQFCVASKNLFDVGLALIHEGADPRRSSSGYTALMNAAGIGNLPMLKILLPLSDIQATVLAPNGILYSAESLAELNGNGECAELIRAFSLSQTEKSTLSLAATPPAARAPDRHMRL